MRITIIYGPVESDGETVERATAYIEGHCEATLTNVDSHGDREDAIAQAARIASRRYESAEQRSRWAREIEDYGPMGPMGHKGVQ